jgi:hypothetical protein
MTAKPAAPYKLVIPTADAVDDDRLVNGDMTGEGAKTPTRLPPDCDTPPVWHQARL